MDRLCWLKVSVLICLFAVSGGRELKVKHEGHAAVYNHTLARILVEYASAVYMSDLTELFTWTCSRCTDMTEGFEMIELIVDVQYCLQAFVGVAHDLNSIVIAFRGTQEHSIQNWIEDLFWKQLDLNYPGMSDAMVHSGFYSAYHNTTVRLGVLNAVQRAQELYGEMGIMVTGHSMGGAMASFCALDLVVNNGAKNVQVMTFGQPRIGNLAFSSYFSKHVPNTIRVTNERDIVPHLPPYYSYFPQKTYHHFPRELVGLRGLKIETMISMRSLVEIGWAPILKQLISIPFLVDIDGALGGPNLFPLGAHPEIWPGLAMLTWRTPKDIALEGVVTCQRSTPTVWLYSTGFGSLVYRVEKVCDGSGEDPSCSRSVAGNSISDHLEYFGAQLQAETWGSCRIVMDRGIIKLYGTEDNNNSFVLSRDPTTSVLMLRNQMGGKISSV